VRFKIDSRHLNDVVVLATTVFEDDRGFFTESFRADYFAALGLPMEFPQDSHSRSRKGVVRGLHFQFDPPMGKVTRVTSGSAFLVAVDIRKGSPTLGQWAGLEISAENRKQLWVPPGFAFGFCVLTDYAEVQYKCTQIYNPHGEGAVRWNDPEIGIPWPIGDECIVSEKDCHAQTLREWLGSPQSSHFAYRFQASHCVS
jgi:dTDP-4-dehydrorhamnose 3,5-epimerase